MEAHRSLPSISLTESLAGFRGARAPEEMRPVFIEANPGRPGTSSVAYGDSVVLCTVLGPMGKQGRIHDQDTAVVSSALMTDGAEMLIDVNVATAEDSRSPDLPQELISLAGHLKDTLSGVVELDKLSGTLLHLQVTVLSQGGSLLACSTTCASMALAHAGIPMKDILVGLSLAAVETSPRVLDYYVDVEASEEQYLTSLSDGRNYSWVDVAVCHARRQVSFLRVRGGVVFSPDISPDLSALAEAAANQIGNAVKRALRSAVE
ncbi:MAG: uncharacterized protein KVP18_002837 [Porospora cf. gigantea A]|uniref:uncharacterized protein n=1 Tax=Porospora cf. gigantea A TaxID=2853593 RepID=UPI003559E1DA|nr:MAG: hypothetical protein KVP18_002837 [Porospora cf. gigantea A]